MLLSVKQKVSCWSSCSNVSTNHPISISMFGSGLSYSLLFSWILYTPWLWHLFSLISHPHDISSQVQNYLTVLSFISLTLAGKHGPHSRLHHLHFKYNLLCIMVVRKPSDSMVFMQKCWYFHIQWPFCCKKKKLHPGSHCLKTWYTIKKIIAGV